MVSQRARASPPGAIPGQNHGGIRGWRLRGWSISRQARFKTPFVLAADRIFGAVLLAPHQRAAKRFWSQSSWPSSPG